MTANPDTALRALAGVHGIAESWRDVWGVEHRVEIDVLRALLRALNVASEIPAEVAQSLAAAEAARWPRRLPALLTADRGTEMSIRLGVPTDRAQGSVRWRIVTPDGASHAGTCNLEPTGHRTLDGLHGVHLRLTLPSIVGYATLSIQDGALGETELAIAPDAAPAVPLTKPGWGLGVQIYGLSTGEAGDIGHFGNLARIAAEAAAAGADALAISPVHALFAADANHCSPYAPSNRQFLNGLLAYPTLGDMAEGAARTVGTDLIQYDVAMPARIGALRALFDAFDRDVDANRTLHAEFAAFRDWAGPALEQHASFEALHANHFGGDPALWHWRSWPAGYRRPDTSEVRAFVAQRASEVRFHTFLQWLADRQLALAQSRARRGGMGIGLISDLAVGTHGGGSRAWGDGSGLLGGASIGAPPDLISTQGQDWGLTTFSPTGLVAQGFAPFRADLRRAMRHVGGVRLDHVMGMTRVWCIPEGASARYGAYIRMPWPDLARLTAVEAQRNGCIVIGEDLGTLPDGFRDELARRRFLGMRVLWFERDGAGRFLSPCEYGTNAVAMTSTHDLPTIVGWWSGLDIDWRVRLGLLGETETPATLHVDRAAARAALWSALLQAGFVANPAIPDKLDADAVAAIVGFVGATPTPLMLLPLEDALMLADQPNLPGTTTQHPNWRRLLNRDITGLLRRAPASIVLGRIAAFRGRTA